MSSNQFDQRVLELVNQERVAAGLDSLAINSQLDRAADLHTDEMIQADFISHQLPGEMNFRERITASGYNWTAGAENIAAGYTTPEAVVDGWLNSPKHRQNILNPESTDIGIGYGEAVDDKNGNGDYDTYWTQIIAQGNNQTAENEVESSIEVQDEPTNQENQKVDDLVPSPESNELESNEPQSSEPQSNELESNEPQSNELESSEPQSSEPESNELESNEPESNEPESNELESSGLESSGLESSGLESSEPESSELEEEIVNTGSNDYDQRILELVNQERATAGLDSLSINSQLDRAADLHTNEMVQADRMSHQLPGEADLGDRIRATGYEPSGWAENVAAGQQTPEQVMDSWMNSPGHRQNILNPSYTELGVGYQNAVDDKPNFDDTDVYWTQVFGTDVFGNA